VLGIYAFEHYLYFMTEEQLRKRWDVGSSGVDVSADSLFTSDAILASEIDSYPTSVRPMQTL